jgi:hypothetical protein
MDASYRISFINKEASTHEYKHTSIHTFIKQSLPWFVVALGAISLNYALATIPTLHHGTYETVSVVQSLLVFFGAFFLIGSGIAAGLWSLLSLVSQYRLHRHMRQHDTSIPGFFTSA